MNLTEKLAAADDDDDDPPRRHEEEGTPKRPAGESAPKDPKEPHTAKNRPGRQASDRANTSGQWAQSKQKVQAKVLAEIAPKAADLSPDELRVKVRSTVNEILEREDIGISPIEHKRFVEEMLEDSLGYGQA